MTDLISLCTIALLKAKPMSTKPMEIVSAEYLGSYVDYQKCPWPNLPEYAFIGRSNVGKSSLINMLSGKTHLAKVSRTPGKTQTINHFLVNQSWYLVDLPGYGFAQRSQSQRSQWERMISGYMRHRKNLVSVFVLLDSRLTPQKLDLEFIRRLGEWQLPFQMVFTKTDKSTQAVVAANVRSFLNALREEWEFLPAHFLSSAPRRQGRSEILDYIQEHNLRFRAYADSDPSRT